MTVSIIGGGIMGLSVARGLLGEGHEVRLFEQGEIPHEKGSSCDDHRLIRHPYGSHIGYMQMVEDAYQAWQRLWEDLGRTLYTPTGTLVVSTTQDGWALDSLDALKKAKLEVRIPSRKELQERYPYLHAEDIALSFFMETGGALHARDILRSLKQYLVQHNVSIHERMPVRAIDPNLGRVYTSEGRWLDSDVLVVTAGPWLSDLLPEYTTRVTPSTQSVLYFQVPDHMLETWQRMPMILDIGPDSGFYLVPPVSGLGLKIGDHRFSLQGHPNDRESQFSEESIRAAIHRLPVLEELTRHRTKTCYYTVAQDERFMSVASDKAWILTGFSGHGFKFGPLIGERMAKVISGLKSGEEFQSWLAGF